MFFLADTAGLLFGKPHQEEVQRHFEDRSRLGFTTIQDVILRDLFEPNTPNAYGTRPFAGEADMHAVRMNPELLDYFGSTTRFAAEHGFIEW